MKKILDVNKPQKGKGLPRMLALCLSELARVAKVSDCKVSDRKHIKILSPKQMLQRLPIAPAQVKAGNTTKNLPNEIRQIIYSLYRAKEITKKVHNNIMNSINL